MYVGKISCRTIFLLLTGCVKEEFSHLIFFCVYMDDLSNKLNNINAGCIIGSSLINHFMYADDLVLMAPSSMGLSMLLYVCSEYGIEHDINPLDPTRPKASGSLLPRAPESVRHGKSL